MAISFNIVADKTSLTYGDRATITATGTDVPADATVTYKWTAAGGTIPEKTNKLVLSPNAGSLDVQVTATVNGTDYPSNTVTLLTQKAVMPSTITVDVSPTGPFTDKQLPIPLTTTISGQPTGSTATYYWRSGGSTVGTDSVFMAKGSYDDLALTTIISNPNYTDFTVQENVPVVVIDTNGSAETPSGLRHFDILEDGTPFIRLNYWELDELKAMLIATSEGYQLNPTEASNSEVIKTIQHLGTTYGKFKVQESRNGKIYDQSYFTPESAQTIYPYGWYTSLQEVPGADKVIDFTKKNTPGV